MSEASHFMLEQANEVGDWIVALYPNLGRFQGLLEDGRVVLVAENDTLLREVLEQNGALYQISGVLPDPRDIEEAHLTYTLDAFQIEQLHAALTPKIEAWLNDVVEKMLAVRHRPSEDKLLGKCAEYALRTKIDQLTKAQPELPECEPYSCAILMRDRMLERIGVLRKSAWAPATLSTLLHGMWDDAMRQWRMQGGPIPSPEIDRIAEKEFPEFVRHVLTEMQRHREQCKGGNHI